MIVTDEESIMISEWPKFTDEYQFTEDADKVDIIKDGVRAIRNIRTEMNVPPSKKASVIVVSDKENIRNVFEESSSFFGALAYANDIKTQSDKTGIADDAVSVVIHNAVIYIPFAELVDEFLPSTGANDYIVVISPKYDTTFRPILLNLKRKRPSLLWVWPCYHTTALPEIEPELRSDFMRWEVKGNDR